MNKIQGPWTARGTLVFFAGNAGGFDLRNCPHAEEKARLAAAAPDLLEALELIAAQSSGIVGSTSRADCMAAVASAAILKATGGAS